MTTSIINKTDRITYVYADSGCKAATEYLTDLNGRPTLSRCLDCPFEKCKEEPLRRRKESYG